MGLTPKDLGFRVWSLGSRPRGVRVRALGYGLRTRGLHQLGLKALGV